MAPLGTAGLLRLATAGSVDDGKSTLVGRLLYDCKAVLADQLEAIRRTSERRGLAAADLGLLTDGLRAEREQGITIDVAYRYFSTARRRFVLADTPGHVQYTRNMVTGASTAGVAVILTDARYGVVEQTRRHTAVAALLRVPHVVLAVNKMDLVDYDKGRFAEVAEQFGTLTQRLGVPQATPIPVSALRGDNVASRSDRMGWYEGPTLLEFLEDVPVDDDLAAAPARFPVQYVIRHADYRGYAGRLASGSLGVGDEVVVAGRSGVVRIDGIDVLGEPAAQAVAGQSIAVRLAEQLDVSRGDLIAPAVAPPPLVQDLAATVCHLADRPLFTEEQVLVKHGTRTVRALVRRIGPPLDIGTQRTGAVTGRLVANDIAAVELRTAEPLPVDSYADNRVTGCFLVIDPTDGATLCAGIAGERPWRDEPRVRARRAEH